MPNDANVPTGSEHYGEQLDSVSKVDVAEAVLRVIKKGWADLSPDSDMNPEYWEEVFREIYREKPIGNNDARWDYLLHDRNGPKALKVSRHVRAGLNK